MFCTARLGIVTQCGVAIISMVRRPPLFVLATTRPEFRPPGRTFDLSIPTFVDRREKERPCDFSTFN